MVDVESLAQRLKKITQAAAQRIVSLEFLPPEIKANSGSAAILREHQARLENGGLLKIVSVGGGCKKIVSSYPALSPEEEAAIVSLAQRGDERASRILLVVLIPLVYRVALSFVSGGKGLRQNDFCENFEELAGNCLDTLMDIVCEDIVLFEAESYFSLESFVISRLQKGLYAYWGQARQRAKKYQELTSE